MAEDPIETALLDDALTEPRAASAGAPPEPAASASMIGRFVILREAGEGGIGRVFVAYDPELDRKVALKLLKARGGPEAASLGRQQLQREAQAMAQLAHPNVVTVFDVGVVGDEVFVAMEYVEGETLREWLRSGQRRREEILAVFIQAGRGLVAAHDAGIVHRDFKPDNVMIGADGRVRVLDFGLALAERGAERGAEREVPDGSTSASGGGQRGFSGTPAYMAPEQYAAQAGDPRSDMFSFAVSLWEALVGARPFVGVSVSALRRAVSAGRIREPPRERRLPRRLDELLRRALAVEPSDRFPSMAALLAELERDPWLPLRRAARVGGVGLVLAALVTLIYVATRPGSVVVEVVGPRGALRPSAVWVGDVALAPGPGGAAGEVAPGLYRVRVEAAGMIAREAIVAVERGSSQRIAVALEPTRGYVDVEAAPVGASILVDGVDYGSRLRHLALETGRHDLRARLRGHYERRWSVEVAADAEVESYASLPRALLWSRRQTGVRLPSTWIGDLTGDGLPELAHWTYNVITVSDPWGDRDLASMTLSPNNGHRLAWFDTDGDGVREGLVIEVVDGGLEAALWDPRPAAEGAPMRRRWRSAVGGRGGATPSLGLRLGLGASGLGEGAIDTLVVAEFPRGTTVALDAASGRRRWSAEGDEVFSQAAARRADGGWTIAQASRQEVWARDAATGALLWESRDQPLEARLTLAAGGALVGELVVRELDGDHNEDLLLPVRAGDDDDLVVVALDGASGRLRWHQGAREWQARAPADGDGGGLFDAPAIALVRPGLASDARIAAIDRGGAVVWTASAPLGSRVAWWPGEGDGAPMVEVLHASGVEFRRGDDGELVAEIATDAAPRGAPVHLDWDGDGRLDMVVACDDRTLVGLRPGVGWTGAIAFASDVNKVEAIGDINRDGVADLLVEAFGPEVISGRRSLWQRGASDALRATPVVADLDGDGDLEIAAIGAFTGVTSLHLLDAATGVITARATATSHQTLRAPTLVPAAGGGHDLLVIHERLLRRHSGRDASILAEVEIPTSYSSPAVVDLDGDGAAEVVIVPWFDERPIEVRRLSDLGLAWTIALGGGAWGAPTVVDLGGPPGSPPELVLGLHRGGLVALGGRGDELWRVELGTRQVYAPAAVDLAGDGEVELFASAAGEGGATDLVALAGADGAERRRWPGYGATLGGVGVVALDRPDRGGEERLLIAATDARGVVAFAADGGLRWRLPIGRDEAPPRASGPLVIADLDRDGAAEVIAPFYDGTIYVVDAATGALRWRFATGESNVEATPVPADIDGDGILEVIVAGHDRELVVLRSPRPRATSRP